MNAEVKTYAHAIENSDNGKASIMLKFLRRLFPDTNRNRAEGWRDHGTESFAGEPGAPSSGADSMAPASHDAVVENAPQPENDVAAIYGPERLQVSDAAVASMRAEVARAVQDGVVSAPTDAQWEMILSAHPATCVVAGAGSGKSTTLILRVVFMLCHLGIRPQDLTVVSFTVASCAELRAKLFRVLSFEAWTNRLAPEDGAALRARCERMVSTFHSALARVARTAFGDVQWFDFLAGDRGGQRPDSAEDFDNPAAGGRLNDAQLGMLHKAYRTLFNEDAAFRNSVIAMLRLECARHNAADAGTGEAKAIALASQRDLDLTRMISARWPADSWIMPGVDPTPFVAFRVNNHPFHANGRIVKTGMPIFLSLNGCIDSTALFDSSETIDESGFKVVNAIKVRRNIVARHCDRESLQLKSLRGIEWLRYRVNYLCADDFRNLAAPSFRIKLDGEPATDLVEAFYAQASFIESLGMSVPGCMRRVAPLTTKPLERAFADALARFWPAFEALLAEQPTPLRTFNRAFLELGEQAAHRIALSPASLRPFTHLLVDEFQDISPQIVSWIRAMQRHVREAGEAPTLMAIGDDWQSIYGWRGSAPEIFINFGHHFPVHRDLGRHGECRMMDNYRSIAPVIDDAEFLIRDVRVKIDKAARPVRSTEAGDHGVRLVRDVDLRNSVQVVADEIHRQLAFVNALPSSDKNKVVVLSRSNAVLNRVRAAFGSAPGVGFFTFHGAKGLQGEVVILCDNCVYDDTHVLRNAVYGASGLFRQSYDEAARDEARRLAYVAVTRGIRRVVWFVSEPVGAALTLAQRR